MYRKRSLSQLSLEFGVAALVVGAVVVSVPSLAGFDVVAAAPVIQPQEPVSPLVVEKGRIRLSVDASGTRSTNTTVGVSKPNPFVTVRAAYLTTASTGFSDYVPVDGDIQLAGQVVHWDPDRYMASSFGAYNVWADVTHLVDGLIDGSPSGIIEVPIIEDHTLDIDGSILAVIFDDPTATEDTTIILAYGVQEVTGDQLNVFRASGAVGGATRMEFGIGVSFGAQPNNGNQATEINVDGVRLTSSAGGHDDWDPAGGIAGDGSLITVGGIGDNPTNPFANGLQPSCPRCDDELYDLLPFLDASGYGSVALATRNLSFDDNLFFASLVVEGADVEWTSSPPPGSDPSYFGGGRPYQGTSPDTPLVEDPVNAATGSFYHPVLDLESPPGTLGLGWGRTFESRSDASVGFGSGWEHSYSDRIREGLDDTVEYIRSDGRGFVYQPASGGGWDRPEEAPGELTEEPSGGWRIETLDGTTMLFGVDGRLSSVELWSGETLTAAYAGTGELSSITSSTGASLTLTWASDRIVAVDTSDGRRVDYTYDTVARLTMSATERGSEEYDYASSSQLDEVRDSTGRLVVRNTYDSAGRVLTQTNADGAVTRFDYDGEGLATTVTDETNGETITYQFDTRGRMIAIVDPAGFAMQRTFDTTGNLTGEETRDGINLTALYNDEEQPISVTKPGIGTTLYSYDSIGRVTSMTEPTGAVTSFGYDGSERYPSSLTDALGGSSTIDVVDGLIVSIVDADGVQVDYEYDGQRRRTSATDGLGRTTGWVYDNRGNVVEVVDAAGATTTFVFDDADRVLSQTAADGGVMSYTYDAHGRRLTSVDQTGAVTSHEYDDVGRLVATVDPVGTRTERTFDAAGRMIATTVGGVTTTIDRTDLSRVKTSTSPEGRSTDYDYDADGRVTAATAADGGVSASTFDSDGRLTSTTDPEGHTTLTSYDSFGRVASSTDPSGGITTTTYDVLSRPVAVTAPDGGTTSTVYTPAGRMLSTTDPTGRTNSFTYDAAGQVVTVANPNGETSSYGYDAVGRNTSATSPSGLTVSTTYDLVGRVLSVTDPAGVSMTRTWSLRGELLSDQVSGQAPSAFGYNADGTLGTSTDPLGNVTSYTYDLRKQLVSQIDAKGNAEQWAYDDDGLMTTHIDELGRQTSYGYDLNGRLGQVADPSGRTTSFAYNLAGQLTQTVASIGADMHTVDYTYDTVGRRATMTDPTGVTSYTYDLSGRIASIAAPAGTLSYSYDLAGRRNAVTYPDGTVVASDYDTAGRLATVSTPSVGTASYAYDSDGNLITSTLPGHVRSRTYVDGQVVSMDDGGTQTGLQYDQSGRVAALTGSEDWAYTYDAAGQLVEAAAVGATTHTYGYSVLGERTTVDDPTGARQYSYDVASQIESLTIDGVAELFEYDAAGRLTREVGLDGVVVDTAYDPRGLPTRITRSNAAPDPCENLTATITGTSGNDVISGTNGNDIIFGLGGDDIIDGGNGHDTICGGAGNDTIDGGNGNDTLHGNDGTDTINGENGNDTITGGVGDDIIDGGNGKDTIDAGAGDDTVDGRNGNDTITGGSGNDQIDGWNGNDVIDGGDGDDTLDGRNGKDTISGGYGVDTLRGHNGKDTLDGGPGVDTIVGGSGKDTCEPEPTVIQCEVDLAPSSPPPPGSGDVTTVETRVYNGNGQLVEVEQTAADGTVTTTPITWDLAAPLPQVLTIGDTNYLYGAARELALTPGGPVVEQHDVFGSNVNDGAVYDPWGVRSVVADGVGFGYRGELAVGDRLHLRFRDLAVDHGVFTTTDPMPGFAGETTTSNPFHYVDNNPTNSIDPLGLFTFDDSALEPALEFFVVDPSAGCDGVCGYFDLLIGGAYEGEDITNLNTWDFARYQVTLCNNGGIIDTIPQDVSVLGSGVPGISDALQLCADWVRRYEDLGGDRCSEGFAARVINRGFELVGGGGACYSWGLAVEAFHEQKWEIVANAVTLGRYGCAKDTIGYISNSDAPSSRAVSAVVQCVGFAFGLSALRGGFQGVGTLRRPGVSRAPNGVADDLASVCSFSGGTEVLMGTGVTRQISQVAVGDWVLAKDPETGERGAREVTHLWVHQDTVMDLEVGASDVVTTEDHPFWNASDGEWQRADALDPGDLLLTAGGGLVAVGGMDWGSARATTAYNLSVDGLHTYFVAAGDEEILVHNTCPWQLKVDKNTENLVLDGALPASDGLARLNTGQLRDLQDDLITSVANRQTNLFDPQFADRPLSQFVSHAQRITQEQDLLARVQKLLGN